jgi:Uma2 family endonuclease
MHQRQQSWITPEDYLAWERQADTKSEYWNGEVYAMAGASPRHTLITANTITSLSIRLRGRPCTVHTGDLRIKISPTGMFAYPDVVVVCGAPRFDDKQQDTVLNPAVLVEVLSKSTESYDRGTKFEHYRTLESLTDYVLISQDHALVEHRARQGADRWLMSYYMGLDTILPLEWLGFGLPLAEIYDKVGWDDDDAARGWLRAVKEPQEPYNA